MTDMDYFAPFCEQKPMALHIVHSDSGKIRSSLALWSDDLPVAQMESMLPSAEFENYRGLFFKLEKRRKEWLRTRILLDHLVPGARLQFLPNGKPVLTESCHVSISHSGNVAAVVIASQLVGIDVQSVDPKLERISGRYCNEKDMSILGTSDLDHKLAMIWAAKEAVFKYFGEKVDFAGEMTMMSFQAEDETLHLDYSGRHGRKHFELGHLFWERQHVVFTK